MIFTSRSVREDHHQHCPRKRYWKYHHNGYGIVQRFANLELETGVAVHENLANILKVIQLNGPTPISLPLDDTTRRQLREIVFNTSKRYTEMMSRKGGFYLEDKASFATLVKEQVSLIEGITWAWIHEGLPALLAEFEIVLVEHEAAKAMGCDCPAEGDARWERHTITCDAVFYMVRPDIILRRRSDGQLGNHDFKTEKQTSDYTVRRYVDSVQMASGSRVIEELLGEPVTHYYVHFLVKGERRASYVADLKDYSGPKRQQSHFCYVDYEPANPPLTLATFGSGGRWYLKSPVWELELGSEKPPGWTRMEYVVEMLGKQVRQDALLRIGPYPRQNFLINGYFASVEPDERRWNERIWAVYEKRSAGMPLTQALDEEIVQSWDCVRFGKEHMCPYYKICHQEDGITAENVDGPGGIFEPRIPHHEPERLMMERLFDEVAQKQGQEE